MANSDDSKGSSGDSHDVVEVVLSSSTSELRNLAGRIEEFAERHALSDKTLGTISLVLEEAVTNVMMYAFEGIPEARRKVSVRLQQTPGLFCATILDNGLPFDPTIAIVAERTEPAEERLGGWGIKLIRNLMDEVRYRRVGDVNQLELILKT